MMLNQSQTISNAYGEKSGGAAVALPLCVATRIRTRHGAELEKLSKTEAAILYLQLDLSFRVSIISFFVLRVCFC